jgi:Asp-tRNA(Asn)/Glu-tRNA(Gln) amidotransferase C subunit
MEWLEFSRWSDEVTQTVVAQMAHASELRRSKEQADRVARKRERVQELMRTYAAINPWGHPEKN